jgi:hypothetical protein
MLRKGNLVYDSNDKIIVLNEYQIDKILAGEFKYKEIPLERIILRELGFYRNNRFQYLYQDYDYAPVSISIGEKNHYFFGIKVNSVSLLQNLFEEKTKKILIYSNSIFELT